ncbi:MAG: M1 family metallopeptidase [Candidatus Bipolaricaulota bacterium]|nr:MAG: M1 family metallopeptidase [Candidatus Bipolaricaulota bacterium]
MRRTAHTTLLAACILLTATVSAATQSTRADGLGLLGIAWSDPTPFLHGLIAAEQTPSAARIAAGASLYQVRMTIAGGLSRTSIEMEIAFTNLEDEPLDEAVLRVFPPIVGGAVAISDSRVDGHPVDAVLDPVDGRLTLPLPASLLPRARAVLRLVAQIEVPPAPAEHYGILEYTSDAVSLAHVLPTLAVHDAQGWHADRPPAYGDVTHADAAFFVVEVVAPAGIRLIASGVETAQEIGAEIQTRSFAVGPAREFYVTATADLEVMTEVVGEVTINSFAPSSLSGSAAQALTTAVAAVQIYSSLYGPYPYRELDIVASPIRAGGMEFPGLVLIGLAEYGKPPDPSEEPVDFFELAVAHEVGHQWFYNVVGNDQLGEPWLDESLTQFATWRYFEARYGDVGDLGFASWTSGRLIVLPTPAPAIGMPVSSYSQSTYGATIYALGPRFLKQLEQLLGREALDDALRAYATDYRWGLGTTAAIRGSLETACQCDLTLPFAQWVYAN